MRTCLAAVVVLAAMSSASAQQALTPEQVTVREFGDFQRVYVADPALPHIVDGRIFILDAADMSLKGMLEAGFSGMMVAAPEKGRIYVASTFYERLTRGKRTDVVQVFDAKTAKLVEEWPISSKRVMALPYRNLFQPSADGRFLYVQNATPATSVTVLDTTNRKTFEVGAPGCYGIYPALGSAYRFATLCGDGTAATYSFKAGAKTAARKAGPTFFDPDKDALFTHAERDRDAWLFVSFKGKLVRVSFEGETAAPLDTADMMAGASAPGWAPGGFQPIAFDKVSGVAYVLMHSDAAEGTHKNPSNEIWAYDVRAKKLLARSPAPGLIALTLAPGGTGALYGIDGKTNKIVRYNIDRESRKATIGPEIKLGETAALIEVPR